MASRPSSSKSRSLRFGTAPRAECFSTKISNAFRFQVDELAVSRNSFEGVSVATSFWMKEVTVPRVPSLAFNFDHVKEFSIYGSRFDRVSMWGFKIARNGVEMSLSGIPLFLMKYRMIVTKGRTYLVSYLEQVPMQMGSFNRQLRRVQRARHDAVLQPGEAVVQPQVRQVHGGVQRVRPAARQRVRRRVRAGRHPGQHL